MIDFSLFQLKQQLKFDDVKDIEKIYSNKFSFDPRASASDAKVPRKYIHQRIHAMGRKVDSSFNRKFLSWQQYYGDLQQNLSIQDLLSK